MSRSGRRTATNRKVAWTKLRAETSVLCKAAVHAGIIPDQFGGAITVEQERGLRYYESVQANGIKSKT
ncbi:discoidin, CUB and LCCL domain-containing protein 1 [Tachysurus ichikawai]